MLWLSKKQKQRRPGKDKEPIINRRLSWLIGIVGVQMKLVQLGIFLIVYPSGLDVARSVLLTAIVMFNFVRIAVYTLSGAIVQDSQSLAHRKFGTLY